MNISFSKKEENNYLVSIYDKSKLYILTQKLLWIISLSSVNKPNNEAVKMIMMSSISVCTMNDTSLSLEDNEVTRTTNDPTGLALLTFVHGMKYE